MSFDFDRPVGATADTQELDFIAALHQTDVEAKLRKDGSIEDNDISLFLSSRYGKCSVKEVGKIYFVALMHLTHFPFIHRRSSHSGRSSGNNT